MMRNFTFLMMLIFTSGAFANGFPPWASVPQIWVAPNGELPYRRWMYSGECSLLIVNYANYQPICQKHLVVQVNNDGILNVDADLSKPNTIFFSGKREDDSIIRPFTINHPIDYVGYTKHNGDNDSFKLNNSLFGSCTFTIKNRTLIECRDKINGSYFSYVFKSDGNEPIELDNKIHIKPNSPCVIFDEKSDQC